ncbi:secretin N-terminal domain-containing protein [Pigmentiphaga sp. CHJ604]|uniref:secretin N-terminal domain-containing protein n=1 Tax=Pigmentiphaga sp. CHJ604 TaxID=3081984 RepID=UPI0030CC8168
MQEQTQTLLRQGHYEDALAGLDQGLAEHPSDSTLRVVRTNAKEIIVSRLLAAAQTDLSSGRPEAADEQVSRLLRIDPTNSRAKEVQEQVRKEARANVALTKANGLVDSGAFDPAQALVEEALREAPSHYGLLELQRKLAVERRTREARNAQRLAAGKPVSLEFRDAGVRPVFEAISRTTGVNFVLDKDIPADLRTTVFLHETSLEDALDLIASTTNLSKKVLDATTILMYPNTQEKQRNYQDLIVRAFYPANASARQIADMLKLMLKVRDPYVDERTNMVVIRENADIVRLAERLVSLQDVPDAEVVLEVEVLEVSSTKLNELGVKFPNSLTLTPLRSSGGTQLTLNDLGNLNSSRIGVSTPSLTLNLRREVGDVNTLANPRIRTKNKEKARILIGDKLPIITTTATSTGFVSENVQFIDVGLKLEVVPTIQPDEHVGIKVDLEVSSLTRQVPTPGGSVTYEIGTRNASTVLKLRDGETQLLAGLIKREERTQSTRLPGLGDVPVMGRLFSSQKDDGSNTEIVLSIMPRIVRSARRPEINFAEFWSGTETNARSRALLLADVENLPRSANEPAERGGVSSPSGGPQGARDDAVSNAPVSLVLKGPSTVIPGESFTVSVNVATKQALRGMPFTVGFDRSRFVFEDVEEGELLKTGEVALSLSKSLQEDTGRVMIGILRNKAEGVVAEGTLATLRFRALGNRGKGQISIVSATPMVIDATPEAVPLPSPLVIGVQAK